MAWTYTGKDECFQVFTAALADAQPPLPETATCLEIGCAEGDWLTPAHQGWPGWTFTGIDWRSCKRPGTLIQGDVLDQVFQPGSFDVITSISAIEHIGLGHYDRDPKAADGDSLALRLAWTWLKPGGWLYFDVPYNLGTSYVVHGTSHRVYDDATITSRLDQGLGWREHWRGYSSRERPTVVTRSKPEKALPLGGAQYYYVACWWQKPDGRG